MKHNFKRPVFGEHNMLKMDEKPSFEEVSADQHLPVREPEEPATVPQMGEEEDVEVKQYGVAESEGE